MALRPIIVLRLAALALAGCGGGSGSGTEAQAPAASVPPASGTTAPAGNGPDISGIGLDGETLSVRDFRGRPVFVNVWSSW
jgi:hypothetical protein